MALCKVCGGDPFLPAGVADPGDDSENPVVGCYGPHMEDLVDDVIDGINKGIVHSYNPETDPF